MNILEKFLENVKKYPNKISVEDESTSLTYQQLFEKASTLSYYIHELGYQNSFIGLIVDHSVHSMVGLLGILFSGNCYIPLDYKMPQEKIEIVLQDANIGLLIEGNKAIIAKTDCKIINLNDLNSSHKMYCFDYSGIDKSTPIYMVYTSGSTGKPKGVLKSYFAVEKFIETYINTFGFTQDEIIGNQTPFYFDAAAKDIYLSLYLGATLEILSPELFVLPLRLIEHINLKKVTFISWVPSALSIVVQLNTFKEAIPEFLKKVFFVGEVMPIKYLKKWMEALPEVQFVNLYGSSEIAGISCYFEVPKNFDEEKLPIGKPLNNCEVFMQEDGELCIISESLALEYFHDEEKTKQAFRMEMIRTKKQRVFYSGDIVQKDDNENYVFVCRKDSQIKHMGHRIELGEIEVAAMALDFVQKCCCLYNEKSKKIVLFIECSDNKEDNINAIRIALKKKLLDYMIPHKFIQFDKLPLNSNGKVDRQLLKTKM